MKKIILTGDILFNSKTHLMKQSAWILKLLYPTIKSALGSDVDISFDILDSKGNEFSREYFYNLVGIKDIKPYYQSYKTSNFTEEQINYLSQFFNSDTIIIGFELYQQFADLLSSFGCQIIDFAYHPYKLFDDLAFGIYTNNINVYNQILKYQVPKDKFYFYTHYWKTFMEYNRMINDKDLENNSALFVGQTLQDKSVERDGEYLNITHFENKIKELKEEYSKVYYLPHPYLSKKRKFIYDYVKKSPYLELITNRSTYSLLASDKIKKVVGISTSVLYEAQYFNKEIEYLYKPLFNVDVNFEKYSYTSILDDYFNPKFWADILVPICNVNSNVLDVNYFKNSHNKVRNISDLYWGYQDLDPIKRITNVEDSIKRLYLKYIAPRI